MVAQAKKKKTSAKTTRSVKKKRSSRKRQPAFRIRLKERLPERAMEIDAIRSAATRIDALEAIQELEAAAETLRIAVTDWAVKVQSFEESTRQIAEDRIEDLLTKVSEVDRFKGIGDLPERIGESATVQIDELLDRLGLMRKITHEKEMEKLRKRMKAAQKAAATRRKKAAAKRQVTSKS